MVSSGTVLLGTGNDDLREGSRVVLRIFMRDRPPFVQTLIAGARLADRTEITIPWAFGGAPPVALDDIERAEIEFFPDRRDWMSDDQWEMTRFVLTVHDTEEGTLALFDDRGVKFERRGVFSTPTLRTYRIERDTIIDVIDEAGRPVPAALVIVNSFVLGSTDSRGRLIAARPIAPTERMIARTLVHEQEYYRGSHNVNSSQNWNYRVYLTNVQIDATGLATPDVRHTDGGTFELRVSRQNTLIGLNLLASFEWDATGDEIQHFRRLIRDCSVYLYNATDGQFFIDTAQIFDLGRLWNDSDFRCFTNPGYRANVPNVSGGFLGWNILGSAMKMARSDDARVYAHEFGHFGFAVRDEYRDDNRMVSCTANVWNPDSPFGAGRPQASCMMWNQDAATKLCSDHPSNPHVDGTKQGSESCWDTLARRYNLGDRWRLRTPVDRGGIPGRIRYASGSVLDPMIGLFFASARIADANLPSLIGPAELLVIDARGAPVAGAFVRTGDWRYGPESDGTRHPHWAIQGKTDGMGRVPLTGLHTGDLLRVETLGAAVEVTVPATPPLVVMV